MIKLQNKDNLDRFVTFDLKGVKFIKPGHKSNVNDRNVKNMNLKQNKKK